MDKAKLLKDLEKHIDEKQDAVNECSVHLMQNYELHRIADALEKLVKSTHSLGD